VDQQHGALDVRWQVEAGGDSVARVYAPGSSVLLALLRLGGGHTARAAVSLPGVL